MNRIHKLAVWFSYSSRAELLSSEAERLQVHGDVLRNPCAVVRSSHTAPSLDLPSHAQTPNIKLEVDLNTTRVASRYGLLKSVMRMNRAIKAVAVQHVEVPNLTPEEWKSCREFEGILAICAVITTLAQCEQHFLGAYRCLILGSTLKRLRMPTSEVARTSYAERARGHARLTDVSPCT
jgi:hypothetical protein